MKKSRLEIKPIRRNLSRVLDSARNGNPESMLKLGKHYSYLKFVDERYEGDNALLLGLYWLSKAAQNGNWEACYWLGAAIETTRNKTVAVLILVLILRGRSKKIPYGRV